MNKLEKLISNLSTYWEISPEKVVDRLNNMNESELNKLINKMTKKFKNGGLIDCLKMGGKYSECKKCGGKVEKGQDGLVSRMETNKMPKVPLHGVKATGSPDRLRIIGESYSEKTGSTPFDLMRQVVEKQDSLIRDMRTGQIYVSPHSGGPLTEKLISSGRAEIPSEQEWSEQNKTLDAYQSFINGNNRPLFDMRFDEKRKFDKKQLGGRVEKGEDGLVSKHPYYRPNIIQSIFGAFSKNPQHPRYDGKGTYSGQIRPSGVQELEVKGPYGSYMQYTHPNGKIIIEDTRNGGVRYDHPESTKNSPFRKTAPADLVEMFQNVGARFYQDGGSVNNTKKITKIEGLEKSQKLPNPPKKKTYVDHSKEWGKSQKVSKNQSKKK